MTAAFDQHVVDDAEQEAEDEASATDHGVPNDVVEVGGDHARAG